ncbi:MAG: hypothetical protein GXY83_08665, partial [Rhodopirellula sp.]|nr:hypothetical protein [Rhodopirellula sp.]
RTFLADIMPKTFDRAETLEVMKRDAAAALTRGAGWWWYEFSAGQRGAAAAEWFADPEVEALAGRLKQVYDFALTLPDRGPAAEIAVSFHPRRPPCSGPSDGRILRSPNFPQKRVATMSPRI